MNTHRIDSNDTFSTEVTVRESDKYSRDVYIKIERHYVPEEIRGTNEVFMTVTQLEQLGRFLVKQADAIRTEQAMRESA